jgi:multiple sugar transport system permease protein
MATVAGTRAPSVPAHATGEKPSNAAGLIWKYVVRILLALFFAFPLLFMFVSSLKPDTQIFADLSSLKAFLPVGDISLDNYTGVFQTAPAARFLINSVLITAVTILLGLLVNSMAAFALSRLDEAARVDGPDGSAFTAASSCRWPDQRQRQRQSSPSCRRGTRTCGR